MLLSSQRSFQEPFDKLLASLRDKNDATLKQYEDSEAKEDAAKGGGSKG